MGRENIQRAGLCWECISTEQFEYVVLAIVRALGFSASQYVGGSSDRGEDVVAFRADSVPGLNPEPRKWVFQCKRTKKPPPKSEILEELANFTGPRVPDTWVLVTTSRPTPEYRRWFGTLGKSDGKAYYVQAWWRDDLDAFVRTHLRYLTNNLSAEIIELLRVQEVYSDTPSDDSSRVTAFCREFSHGQISLYAKGKYIPNLYVRRDLEDRISHVFWSEEAIGRDVKARCETLFHPARQQLERALNQAFQLLAKLEQREVVARRQADARRKEHRATANRGLEPEDPARVLANLLRERVKDLRGELRKTDHAKLTQIQEAIGRRMQEVPVSWFRARKGWEELLSSVRDASQLVLLPPQLNIQPPPHSAERMEADWNATSALLDEAFRQMEAALRAVTADIVSSIAPATVIIDRAGSGKTNLLCHMLDDKSHSHPTLLLFGKEPCNGPDSLLTRVQGVIAEALPGADALQQMDALLEAQGTFLTVLIDGINENRQIAEYNVALTRFLRAARDHRIRVLITCRDIYWSFFEIDNWKEYVGLVVRDELREFSPDEYSSALPLYFAHYHIRCTLLGPAKQACQHPLLLRFFCEAFGSLEGRMIDLGEVPDIRLKELFDQYLSTKAEQLRLLMELRSADLVNKFLFDLVLRMFLHNSTAIAYKDVPIATGLSDTESRNSLYVRLLDEDIIIEEQPEGGLSAKKITFVYESFMEYLLARALMEDPARFSIGGTLDYFALLDSRKPDWINATGVGEFVGLMLISEDHHYTREQAIAYLGAMASGDALWRNTFWRIVGKCSDRQLGLDLFDLFPRALDVQAVALEIPSTLSTMRRYSEKGAEDLVAALLWSAAVPFVVNWTEALKLDEMSDETFDTFSANLVALVSKGFRRDPPVRNTVESIFQSALAYLPLSAQRAILNGIQRYGHPAAADAGKARLVKIMSKAFPTYSPLLLNGIFSSDLEVRRFCSENLRHSGWSRPRLAKLLAKLSQAEGTDEIRRALANSAQALTV